MAVHPPKVQIIGIYYFLRNFVEFKNLASYPSFFHIADFWRMRLWRQMMEMLEEGKQSLPGCREIFPAGELEGEEPFCSLS